MKIQGKQPQREVIHATPQTMKKEVTKQELIFQKKLDSVDDSKTKTQVDKYGNETTTYYDKNGKVLYNRTAVNGYGGYIYGYRDGDNATVRFIDRDKDGNMDEMGYSNEDSKNTPYTAFQAFDVNDDGTFDQGMPCTGENAGKHFNIKN